MERPGPMGSGGVYVRTRLSRDTAHFFIFLNHTFFTMLLRPLQSKHADALCNMDGFKWRVNARFTGTVINRAECICCSSRLRAASVDAVAQKEAAAG